MDPVKDGVVDPKNQPASIPQDGKTGVPPKPEGDKPGTAPAAEPAGDKTVPYGALHEERERRKASDARIEQIKALYGDKIRFDEYGNVLPPDSQAVPAGATVQSAQVDMQAHVDKMWESDPKQAVRTEIAMAINWLDQTQAQMDLQRDAARGKYADFGRWETEVNSYLRTMPLQQRVRPGMIDMAYKYVKGDKIDAILQAERAELARKFAAGELVQGLGAPGTAPSAAAPAAPTLTDDERRIAQAMGVSEADYLKHKVQR